MQITKLIILAANTLAISFTQATPVVITNPSFEEGDGLPGVGTWNNNDPEGWIVDETGGQIGLQSDSPAPTGIDGPVFTFVQGDETSLIQEITIGEGSTAAVGDVFELTVAAFNQNASPSFNFDITNFAGESLIGGPITQDVVGDWADYTVTGTVDTASSEVRLVINANGPQIRIDNVRLEFESASGPTPFQITNIVWVPGEDPGDGTVTITWPSEPGASYSIQAGNTLQDFLEIDDVEASASTTSYSEAVTAETRFRFYRIEKL